METSHFTFGRQRLTVRLFTLLKFFQEEKHFLNEVEGGVLSQVISEIPQRRCLCRIKSEKVFILTWSTMVTSLYFPLQIWSSFSLLSTLFPKESSYKWMQIGTCSHYFMVLLFRTAKFLACYICLQGQIQALWDSELTQLRVEVITWNKKFEF